METTASHCYSFPFRPVNGDSTHRDIPPLESGSLNHTFTLCQANQNEEATMESKRQKNLSRVIGVALIGLTFLVVGPSAQAQEPEKVSLDVQQLKEKLQKLEQTVQELKTQLAGMDQPKLAPAAAKSTQPGAPPPIEQPATTGSTKQEEKKGESSFQVYGFAMLDFGYQFKQNHPDWFDTVRPTKLPSFKDEFAPDGKTFFGVRQSRLGVKSTTATSFGELKTQFEFELFGTGVNAGQTTFRLRHAYGELGHFGAGQTWSAFMDIDVFPNSIEYWGPSGMVFFRNVQARWIPIQGDSNVVIALERPGATADEGIYAARVELAGIVPQFKWPDVTFHARLARKWGYVQVAGIWRKIAWVDTTAHAFNFSGRANGWGVNVSSNLNFTKNDIGKFQVVYGRGIENYMNDAPIDIGVKNNFTNPVKTVVRVAFPLLGVAAFLDHILN